MNGLGPDVECISTVYRIADSAGADEFVVSEKRVTGAFTLTQRLFRSITVDHIGELDSYMDHVPDEKGEVPNAKDNLSHE